MSDGQAWAASFISTSKSKERGMEKIEFDSLFVPGRTLEVRENSNVGSPQFILRCSTGEKCCTISDADADRLEAWLRERKKPQPRRPDEVGVIGDLPSEEPNWPLNGEWGEVGQRPYQVGQYVVEWPETSVEGIRYIAHHETAGWRMSSERHLAIEGYGNMLDWFGKCRFRYLRPLDAPAEQQQEAKPQLIDAVEELTKAAHHLQVEASRIAECSGLDKLNVNLAKVALERADKVLAGLREASTK